MANYSGGFSGDDNESSPRDGICLICRHNLVRLSQGGDPKAYCLSCAFDLGTLKPGDYDPGFMEFYRQTCYKEIDILINNDPE